MICHSDASSEKSKVTAVAWCPVLGGAGRDRVELASGAEDGSVSVDQSEAPFCQ